jgi:Putative endonuclease segE, GIY-YIG domain
MWLYQGKEINEDQIDGYTGFVYLITNLTNNRRYIGKKLFKSTRTKVIKGKRKKVRKDSDWRDYYGSNAALKEDVASLGPENFTREILHLCKSKGTANYLEMKEQIDRRVLESDQWYNDWIMVKVHRSHIKL